MFSLKRSRPGYLLFEVLLATAIFGLVVMGLLLALKDTTTSMLTSQRTSRVRLALQSQLAEARVRPIILQLQTDPADAWGIRYERQWQVIELKNRENVVLNNLYELVVRARWAEEGEERLEEASLLLYRAP
jgi:Tfp pilus assembly protein PilV